MATRPQPHRHRLLLLLLTVAWLGSTAAAQESTVYLIKSGHLFDAASGQFTPKIDILVNGERIAAVGKNLDAPSNAVTVDLSDYYVLPGLIDTHTHLCLQPDYGRVNPILYKSIPYRTVEAVAAAKATLMAGFTTVRDIDSEGADWVDVALRDAINDGLVPGPRMRVATLAISITAGHMNQTGLAPQIDVPQFGAMADTRDELVREIRRQVKYGADFIKLYATGTIRHVDPDDLDVLAQYSVEDMRLVVEEARRHGKYVAAHAYGGDGAKDAIRAGVRSIEHGFSLDDEALDLMVRNGTYWVPTMLVYFPEGARDTWDPKRRAIVDSHKQVFQKAMAKGVKIAFGTDAGALDHGSNALELKLMADYGMRPADILRSATIVAAELMEMEDDIGSVEVGKYADVIAIRQNPLDDIGSLSSAEWVMKGGELVRRP